MTAQILPVPDPILSYWQSVPHFLADLRSTLHPPAECEIAIVGAGLAGVLTAYYILETKDYAEDRETSEGQRNSASGRGERVSVVLLDARQLCSGATGRNGGHVKAQVNTLLNLPNGDKEGGRRRTELQNYVTNVALELKRIAEAENLDCEFELRRSFDVYTDTNEAEAFHKRYEIARKKEEAWTRNVSWIDPGMAEQVTSIVGAKGAFSVPAASFWPYKFVTQLLAVMVKRYPDKLNVQMNTPVTKLTTSPQSPGETCLTTDYGILTAGQVVLATNAYTAGLLPTFKGNIVPVRGMASHHLPDKEVYPHLNNTYNINFGPGKGVDYLNPRPDGGIVVGGGSWLFVSDVESWKNNWDDAHLFNEQVMSYWHGYMQDRFLGWNDRNSKTDYVWTGVMGRTGDGLPLVGRVPGKEGVCVLAGFNGGGMAIIALCARAISRIVVEGKDFKDIWVEEDLLEGFGITEQRLNITY